MSEYIITCDDEVAMWVGNDVETMKRIVRCRDCKFGVDGGKYCAEGCADSWDWRNVEPDGFCAWGVRGDGDAR